MTSKKERLLAEFPQPSRKDWLDKITVDLKGADFERKLVWRTHEGFAMQPFYLREDIAPWRDEEALPGRYPYTRGGKTQNNDWWVRENVDCKPDAAETNQELLFLLSRGITSLGLNIPREHVDGAYLARLLRDIRLDCIELNLTTCQRHMVELAHLLSDYLKAEGYKPESICGSLGFDPISKMLSRGRDVRPLLSQLRPLAEALAPWPHLRPVTVHASMLVDSGVYCYQELGYALAWGSEYMQQLTEQGIDPSHAARLLRFDMGIGSNYFMEIAKFRAARLLWAHIARQYGANEEACLMNINAITTEYNKTLFDRYVNMLRTQTEAMSAAIAGVDSIVVTPFDSVSAAPDEFSTRIARNQQLILKEESHFDKVVDPAGGSYYVETLTHSLAEEAWKLFLDVEKGGGMLEAVVQSRVQTDVANTNKQRHKLAAERREFMLGTNQFPNFTETSEGRQPLTPPRDSDPAGTADHPFATLPQDRLASDFERLRLSTEKATHTPIAFMLTIGNLAMRQARAQFSCNFLAAAGYRVVDNLGFDSVKSGIEAALNAKADIVVLCSSDDEYATYAPEAFSLLGGRAIFIVAGNPASADDLRALGIENFIHVRSNQLETLRALNTKMGIK